MISPELKSIDELPSSIQPLITEFAHKLLESLDENVVSILVYGSAVNGNYHHGVSNINVAVIVRNLDFHVLDQGLEAVQWGRKRKMTTPLFLTKEYILSSLDVFPIEFNGIKGQHKVVFGEDVFKDLDIPRKDIALLCEQQVKGKLLHLRQAYLETASNPRVLKNFLLAAFTDLVPVFKQLIHLKGEQPAQHKEEMLKQLAGIFVLKPEPLLAAYHDKHKKTRIPSHQVKAHLQNFLDQLESLSRHLDSL